LTIERLGEHKNRVLSATEDWQVVEAASKNPAFEKSDASVSRKDPGSGDANVVITEGNGAAQSGRDGVIWEVVSRDRGSDGFTQPWEINGGEERDGERVDRVKLGVSVEEQNDGTGETGVNNIAGTHTSGNLNSSLEKVKLITDDRLHTWQG
jgi:hypothetical protein